MKSQQKKQQEQKPRRLHKVSKITQATSVDLGDYSNATYSITGSIADTITVDSNYITNSRLGVGTIGTGTSYQWNQPYTYTTGTNYTTTGTDTPTVYINTDGLTMKEGADITVGGKSLIKAIEQIEERLGILHPNPELEDRWEQLKELRKQYIEMEKDLLEKEKIMKILKES
jgi:hypothetical protein